MPIFGDLRTLPLPDLLRIASSAQKTGVLEVERNGISRRIEFRKGHVGSCSSNDPRSRLGQFLLFRGRVNEIQLQHLLTLQEATNKRLGLLLVELGILNRQELALEVATNARETIYGLFDWEDAYFRFDDGATLDPDQIEVTLSVEQLISGGQERIEQLGRIRETFPNSGVILTRNTDSIPSDLHEGPLTQRIFDAVDGRRTIADILLHARASEFVTLDFLHRLFGRDLVSIRELRPVTDESATLLDTPSKSNGTNPEIRFENDFGVDTGAGESPDSTAQEHDVVHDIERARELIDERKLEAAMELLRSSCRDHTTDYARRLLQRVEDELVESVWKDESYGLKVPVLCADLPLQVGTTLTPDESFLLSLIDGMTDLQAIVWLTPMREVDVLVTVRRMIKNGVIELAEPIDQDESGAPEPVATWDEADTVRIRSCRPGSKRYASGSRRACESPGSR